MTQLKILYRNFKKNYVVNLVNIVGLSLSLTAVIFLSLYCYSELTTDNYHVNGDRTYIVLRTEKDWKSTNIPGVFKDFIDNEIPQVESSVRLNDPWNEVVFESESSGPIVSNMIYADKDFFSLFSFIPKYGNLELALEDPFSIVLVDSEAKRLFGEGNPVGKTVKYDNKHLLTVKAVVENLEHNSFLKVTSIIPVEAKKKFFKRDDEFRNWGMSNFQLFVKVKSNANIKQVESNLTKVFNDNSSSGEEIKIKLISLPEIYLSGMNDSWVQYITYGDMQKITVLALVGVLILLIALFNFINIASAQRIEKLKQTGIQKILGASKLDVFKSLFIENLFLFSTSALIAIYLVQIFSGIIQDFTGFVFSLKIIFKPLTILFILSSIVILGSLASVLPAIQLARSKVVDDVNKRFSSKGSSTKVRNMLVVTQFTITIILIAFTLLIRKQVEFGADRLTIKGNNIIAVKLTEELNSRKDVLKQQLTENSNVSLVSFTQFYPGNRYSQWYTNYNLDSESKLVGFDVCSADTELISMLNLKLKGGRFFTDSEADYNTALVNEQFLIENKIENPIGATVGNMARTTKEKATIEIVGVVKDFHTKSVNKAIPPLLIVRSDFSSYCLIKTNTNKLSQLRGIVENIKSITENLSPDFPVEIKFLDEAVERVYQSEKLFSRMFSLFSFCAIVISCLGIFALSIFSCQKRVKEIGIRKISGAKSTQIMVLLNKDFLKWVITAFILAVPISYLLMQKWLENFVYKTEIGYGLFFLSGLIAVLIALLTVSIQSYKSSIANPVESLRNE